MGRELLSLIKGSQDQRQEEGENDSLNEKIDKFLEVKNKADMQLLKFNYLVSRGLERKYAVQLSINL